MAMREVSLARLREQRALRQARIVASGQSLAIFFALIAISQDYSHNQYLQAWMSEHFGGLGFLFNGTLAAFYAGLMITFYLSRPVERASAQRLEKREEILVREPTQTNG